MTDIAFASAHIVQAVLVELLRVDKQMTVGEDLIAQFSANLISLCFASNVHLARVRNDFIAQEIAGILCLPFVGERMDRRLDIACKKKRRKKVYIAVVSLPALFVSRLHKHDER